MDNAKKLPENTENLPLAGYYATQGETGKALIMSAMMLATEKSASQLYRYLTGDRLPDKANRVLIAKALNCDENTLFPA